MPVTEVKVDFVNPPKPGKKMGSIKGGGEYYSVWPDKLSLFSPGSTYTIEYDVNERGYKSFKRIVSGMVASNGDARVSQPASTRGGTQSLEMFVMGAINRYCGGLGMAGKPFPLGQELEQYVRDARHGWINGFKDTPSPRVTRDELEDEVPF